MLATTVDAGVTILAAFGGAGVVGGLVAKFISDHASKQLLQSHKAELDTLLESHKASLQRETEQHKLTLKRQELLFGREVEAADGLVRMHRRIYPAYSHPDMDWHNACQEIACRFEEIETEAENYLEIHSAVVSTEVRTMIDGIRNSAAEAKFNVQGSSGDADPQSVETASELLDALNKARQRMFENIRR